MVMICGWIIPQWGIPQTWLQEWKVWPDLALSSDFIVGFPGESDADFADTLKLVNEVVFSQAYSFKYSPRPGTPAAVEAVQLAEEIKAERLAGLQQLLGEHTISFNAACVGRTLPVLLERPGRKPVWMQAM